MVERIEVAKLDEIVEGEVTVVDAGGKTVVLVKVGGDLFAIDDECTHQGCPLSEGDLDGDVLECSCHGSTFNVKTGEVLEGPADEPAPTYPVEVEDETVYVRVE